MLSPDYNHLLKFFRGRKIFITGHTGFKGTWLTYILLTSGAIVTGYSLEPPTDPSLFKLIGLENQENMTSIIGDLRDLDRLKKAFQAAQPDIVLHLAARTIVRDSYKEPVDTYSCNVMGTVHICECVRLSKIPESEGGLQTDHWTGVRSFLNVTSDKVYRNNEWEWGYRETDFLDGYDPYSNSKSCSELVTHAYRDCFLSSAGVRVSTARAGNVIGGGDFANDRIIPDCIRSLVCAFKEKTGDGALIEVRNPHSIRPYEHVLEPVFAYLLIAARQYEDHRIASSYNVGPDDSDCITTGNLVSLFCDKWNSVHNSTGVMINWKDVSNPEYGSMHEARFLKLDCSKFKSTFNWQPGWHIHQALDMVVAFATELLDTMDLNREERAERLRAEMNLEIEKYMNDPKKTRISDKPA